MTTSAVPASLLSATTTTSHSTTNHSEPLARPGKGKLWTGRVLSGLALAFFAFDCSMKVLQLAPAVEGTKELGYPAHSVFTIGLIQLACVLLYAVPRTAALGAILLTGYLGGAIATHVRVENPLFSHILFPIYIAALVWGGPYLRDARLSVLLPFGAQRTR
jgi:hypothetical protein